MNDWNKIIFVQTVCVAGWIAASSAASAPLPASEARRANDYAWVQSRAKQLEPTANERRIDEIGWARDIREAERLAKANQRPVFLFTHDGRINTGRC